MGFLSDFTTKRQMIGIVDAIAEGIGAVVEDYDTNDKVDGIDDENLIRVAKINTSELDDLSEFIYVAFIKVGKENAATIKVKMQGGIWTELDGDVYILDDDGIREMFNDISKRFKKFTAPEDAGEIVENMMNYDILLKDFCLVNNADEAGEFDLCRVAANESQTKVLDTDIIAHKVTAISRFTSESYVIFDVACKEYMVLIIIDKKTAEVKEIRTIGVNDKDSLNKFKEFVTADAGSFLNYMQTQKLIF